MYVLLFINYFNMIKGLSNSSRLCVFAVIFFFVASISYAQDKPQGTIQLKPDDIKWVDAPPPLPAGSKLAILEGNPKLDGIFTIRAMFPPYFKIAAHNHPKDERVTVISGAVYVGFGDKMDTTNANKFTEGCYYLNPAGADHYVFTQSEGCVLQITGLGPWGLNYVEDVNDFQSEEILNSR